MTLDDLERDLLGLIPDGTNSVVIHSGLWGILRHIEGAPEDLPARIVDRMLAWAQDGLTVVFPTYAFEFPRTQTFDLVRTRATTGVIAETFMAHPDVRRMAQPMNSYAVAGPRAEELLALPCTTSWGSDSAMGWFEANNTTYISLGVSVLLSCSYFHFAEEKARVPYRYFKRFLGTLFDDGREVGPCSETMYVRPLGCPHDFLGTEVDRRLEAVGLKRRPAREGGVLVEALSMNDVNRMTMDLVTEDAYALIVENGREGLRKWVAEGGLEAEKAAVPAEQQVEP
ncbi:MAG: AAC(3) family N-acetyltransferase [Alphaproteobacteria bacterium]|uniref:AAC(3) family N-acetyltransferase n=1 Tax=Nisaea sp. TaxID=2024842 RepID=UPI00326482A7|tara:strand:+ start:23678 stop:24529 length:852 start_codon:yes stop_codon:yes gene_type:complete